MSHLGANTLAPTPRRLEEGSPPKLPYEPLAPQSIKRKVPLLRRCAVVLSIYPQNYNVKVISPQNGSIPAGPTTSQHVEEMPDGWNSHRHPYGHGYYTQQDDDKSTLRLVTYSGPEAHDTLREARNEILTSLESHGGVLPPKSLLVVVIYSTAHPIQGGYYFVDLEQKVIFWYVTQHSALSFGLNLTSYS